MSGFGSTVAYAEEAERQLIEHSSGGSESPPSKRPRIEAVSRASSRDSMEEVVTQQHVFDSNKPLDDGFK